MQETYFIQYYKDGHWENVDESSLGILISGLISHDSEYIGLESDTKEEQQEAILYNDIPILSKMLIIDCDDTTYQGSFLLSNLDTLYLKNRLHTTSKIYKQAIEYLVEERRNNIIEEILYLK